MNLVKVPEKETKFLDRSAEGEPEVTPVLSHIKKVGILKVDCGKPVTLEAGLSSFRYCQHFA